MKSLEMLRYIGPGLLVTVGFIDPGNWASNITGGSAFGYNLLWVISLGTIVLIVLQHNVAHLGIVTGECLAEGIFKYFSKKYGRVILKSAILANISVTFAELLGAGIAIKMLFNIPLKLGAIMAAVISLIIIFTNTYKKIEKIIVSFVSIIGFSFLFELTLIDVQWDQVFKWSIVPNFPEKSEIIIMGIFGAIVMPHNLFLHSEVIKSRNWNLEDEKIIERQLKYEYFDTLFSMILGWIINSAMIILSAACFFYGSGEVSELEEAHKLLVPLLGEKAGIIFAIGLLFAGLSSSITAGMAGGTISSGMNGEMYNIKGKNTQKGVLISVIAALIAIFFVENILYALILSQALLCVQLPLTVGSQLYLTSSEKVMGKYKNKKSTSLIILIIGILVTILNIYTLYKSLK